MAGFLTKNCIWGAAIFVDHHISCMTLLLRRPFLLSYLLKDMQAMEVSLSTLIELIMVALLTLVFKTAIQEANQTISFCSVRAHHQNGIVKQHIKELTLISWILHLYAQHHWPDYITTMMWPFALKEVAYQFN